MHDVLLTRTSARALHAATRGALAVIILAAASFAAGAPAASDRYELVGSAIKTEGSIQLTHWDGSLAGAIWGHHPMRLDRSFIVQFSFSLHAAPQSLPQADGIALVIQTNGRQALGQNGGGIGYLGLDGIASVVTSWFNNRVGFSLDGDPFSAPSGPADLGSAKRIFGEETVTYDATAHTLTMTGRLDVDGTEYDIADARDADLAALLGSTEAFIGFTGGTGSHVSDQRIRSWSFQYTS